MVVVILNEDYCCINFCNQNGHGLLTALPREYSILSDRNKGGDCEHGFNRDAEVGFLECMMTKLD